MFSHLKTELATKTKVTCMLIRATIQAMKEESDEKARSRRNMKPSSNNRDCNIATASEKEMRHILFGMVFVVNTINNENKHFSIDCQLSHGVATCCFNGIGIEIPESNVLKNVFNDEINYVFYCHYNCNENFCKNESDYQLQYPRTPWPHVTRQVGIILSEMNNARNEMNVLNGLLDICLCYNNNDNEIIFGMFDFDLFLSIVFVFFDRCCANMTTHCLFIIMFKMFNLSRS